VIGAPRSGRPRVAFALAAVCAILFVVLAVLVAADRLTGSDTREILEIRSHASPGLTDLMQAASLIANGRVAVPVALATAALLYRFVSARDAAVYAVACIGGEVANLALKAIVHHHRPVGISPKLTDAGWYSFPSGHEMLAVIIFGLGAFLLTRRASWLIRAAAVALAAAFVVLVAASRVYLGAHWPSDVVGAALAGFSCAALCIGIGARWSPSWRT
jgi:undecaprenyl-diphosphatase